MPRIVITHDTAVDYLAQDGSNFVAVAADVDDVDAVMTALSSPPAELDASTERHGVLPPMTIFVQK